MVVAYMTLHCTVLYEYYAILGGRDEYQRARSVCSQNLRRGCGKGFTAYTDVMKDSAVML